MEQLEISRCLLKATHTNRAVNQCHCSCDGFQLPYCS